MEADEQFGRIHRKYPTARKFVWLLGLLIVCNEGCNLHRWIQQNKTLLENTEFDFNEISFELLARLMLHCIYPAMSLMALFHTILLRFWPGLSLKSHSLAGLLTPLCFALLHNLVFSVFDVFRALTSVLQSRHSFDMSIVYHVGGQMYGITSYFYEYQKNEDSLGLGGYKTSVWRLYLDASVTCLFCQLLILVQFNVIQLYMYSYHKAKERAQREQIN